MSDKYERYQILDIIRGLAIILVVIGHYLPENAPEWYKMLNKAIYSFHMPVFLFVSGYVYIATKKEESYFSFLYKKVKRLLIPYYITSIIVITIKLFTQSRMYVQHPINVNAYIEMFYSPVAGYFLWFVLALWWMFVILPWFKTRSIRLVLFGISIVLAAIPVEFTHILCIKEFKLMFMYFMCGVVVYDYKERFSKSISELSKSILIPISFIVLESLYLLGYAEWLKYILSFVGIAFMAQLSNMVCSSGYSLPTRIILCISSSSYIIYLFHTTFEGFGKSLLYKLQFMQISNDIIFGVGVLFVVLLGIIGPLCLYSIFKRFNITKFLFGVK